MMRVRARLAALAGALVAASAVYAGADSQQEAQALIGLEYQLSTGTTNGQTIAEHPSCSNVGGTLMWVRGKSFDDWSAGEFECKGQRILLLKRQVNASGAAVRWRIVDTQLLPPYAPGFDDKRPFAPRLHSTGECALDGRTDTLFFVLLRWGKRERVDWRTGVERAWGFNLDAERIVPLSTRRIVCEKPDPLD